MSALIKSQLIKKLAAKNVHLYERDLERVINICFSEITESLAKNKRVELRGFGAFSVAHRRARKGRNPRTNQSVDIEEKYLAKWKAGKELKNKLNAQNKTETENQ